MKYNTEYTQNLWEKNKKAWENWFNFGGDARQERYNKINAEYTKVFNQLEIEWKEKNNANL